MPRPVFHLPAAEGIARSGQWLKWAQRGRIRAFVPLARTMNALLRTSGLRSVALNHGLPNGRVKSTNRKIRLLMPLVSGFHSSEAPISLALLDLRGHRLPPITYMQHPNGRHRRYSALIRMPSPTPTPDPAPGSRSTSAVPLPTGFP